MKSTETATAGAKSPLSGNKTKKGDIIAAADVDVSGASEVNCITLRDAMCWNEECKYYGKRLLHTYINVEIEGNLHMVKECIVCKVWTIV